MLQFLFSDTSSDEVMTFFLRQETMTKTKCRRGLGPFNECG